MKTTLVQASQRPETERLALVENEINVLRSGMDSLRSGQENVERKIDAMAIQLSGVGRWDTKSILTIAAVAAGLIAGQWGLAIAPLKQEIESVSQNAASKDIVNTKLSEIETQFKASGMLRNIENMWYDRWISALTKRATGYDVPPRGYWPAMYREPNGNGGANP